MFWSEQVPIYVNGELCKKNSANNNKSQSSIASSAINCEDTEQFLNFSLFIYPVRVWFMSIFWVLCKN